MTQDSLFDLGAVTVQSTEAKIRAEQLAKGDTAAGRRKIFESATIRQVTLAYGWKEHREVIRRLEAVMAQTKTKNPSEALLHLLDCWEGAKTA